MLAFNMGTANAILADAILDLVSSGTTLRENNLKEIARGAVLTSQEALEAEETEGGNKSRSFTALEQCEKNEGVGMLLRCILVMGNVTFFSEQNQMRLVLVCASLDEIMIRSAARG